MRAKRIQFLFQEVVQAKAEAWHFPRAFQDNARPPKTLFFTEAPEATPSRGGRTYSIPSNSTQIFFINFNLSSIAWRALFRQEILH